MVQQAVQLKSNFDVDLVMHPMGSDEIICKAARVSTLGADSIDSEESAGLIRFLMNNRHGTPFEHGSMMFRITAPIFVWREFMRHRIGVSYNEQSGRYMELSPLFYTPHPNRPLIQVGKAGQYQFEHGNMEQFSLSRKTLVKAYEAAWESYQIQLQAGIAKEVARMCLPVSIYSSAYVTLNPRSMMHFLSLRTKHEDSKYPSFPMWEINQVANQMERIFSEFFPITHSAFNNAGRVAP